MLIDKLGIRGIPGDVELAIWAGMTLGEPLLLFGNHGTAKTAIINLIGAALRNRSKLRHPNDPSKWFQYQIYDASKINFEDLVGLPNPKALQEGRMEFINSPLTVWNKKLIGFDEFSRQRPERQSNIFELIRSKRLMGLPTKVVWVINAMNPMTYTGTEELDDALVDRHLFFLPFPDFSEMTVEQRNAIIRYVGTDDAPALKALTQSYNEFDSGDKPNLKLAQIGEEIVNLLANSAKEYVELDKSFGQTASRLIDKTCEIVEATSEAAGTPISLSGRRAGMLYRGLLALMAVNKQLGTQYSMRELFSFDMLLGIPVGIAPAMSKNVDALRGLITNTVSGLDLENGDVGTAIAFYDVMAAKDPFLILRGALDNRDKFSKPQRRAMVDKVQKSTWHAYKVLHDLLAGLFNEAVKLSTTGSEYKIPDLPKNIHETVDHIVRTAEIPHVIPIVGEHARLLVEKYGPQRAQVELKLEESQIRDIIDRLATILDTKVAEEDL